MATTDTHRHETDDLLRNCLLSDERLTLAEAGYPGAVRVSVSGRYHAVVDVWGISYVFNIKELATGERELVGTFDDESGLLKDYVWHRAAEAMFAHRRGHIAARIRRELRKPKRDDD